MNHDAKVKAGRWLALFGDVCAAAHCVAGAPLEGRGLGWLAAGLPRLGDSAAQWRGLWAGAGAGDIPLATYDANGEAVGVRLWCASGERLAPRADSGLATSGAVVADAVCVDWWRGGDAPDAVWIAEGEPDWASACMAAVASGLRVAVIGIYSGAWSPDMARHFAALPAGVKVGILADRDRAGERYAATIRASLPAGVECYRWGWSGGDVNDRWQDGQDIEALISACEDGPPMPPPPSGEEDRWQWGDADGWTERAGWAEARERERAWAAAAAAAKASGAEAGDAHLERARKWARAAYERSLDALRGGCGRDEALRVCAPVASLIAGGALDVAEVRQGWMSAYVDGARDRETRLDRARLIRDVLSYRGRERRTLEDIARTLAAGDAVRRDAGPAATKQAATKQAATKREAAEVAAASVEAFARDVDTSWQDGLPRTKSGAPKIDARWMRAILDNDRRFGRVRYDKLKRAIRVYGSPAWVCGAPDGSLFEDAHIDLLRTEVAAAYGTTTPPADAAMAGLRAAAATDAFDPLSDYLRGLSWDGAPRLDNWLVDYCHIDSPEMGREVGPRWMIGAVARALFPGAKMDNSLIFEGAQGTRKSSAAEALVPWDKLYMSFAADPGSKASLEDIQGKWIVELAEMAMLSRGRDMRTIKDFISRTSDTYREAYGYVSADRDRRCVFFGTINPEGAGDYLADSTGNRRWWPVRVLSPIDVERIRADRDQLWAEAVARYDAGEPWHVEPGSASDRIISAETSKRSGLDEWGCIIAPWMEARQGREVTVAEIMRDALDMEPRQMDKGSQMRVAVALRQLGWEPHKGSKGARAWRKV